MSTADSPFSSLTPTRKQLGLGSSYCRHDLRKGGQTPGSCLTRLPHPRTYKDPHTRDMSRDTHMPTYIHTHTHTHTLRIRKKRPLLLTSRQTQTLQRGQQLSCSAFPALLRGFQFSSIGDRDLCPWPGAGIPPGSQLCGELEGLHGGLTISFFLLKNIYYFRLHWVSLVAVGGLLLAAAFLVVEHRL